MGLSRVLSGIARFGLNADVVHRQPPLASLTANPKLISVAARKQTGLPLAGRGCFASRRGPATRLHRLPASASTRTMSGSLCPTSQPKDSTMKWEKPAFKEFRLGFEVTMYVMHR